MNEMGYILVCDWFKCLMNSLHKWHHKLFIKFFKVWYESIINLHGIRRVLLSLDVIAEMFAILLLFLTLIESKWLCWNLCIFILSSMLDQKCSLFSQKLLMFTQRGVSSLSYCISGFRLRSKAIISFPWEVIRTIYFC